MRLALSACVLMALTTASCQSCPDGGGADNSLFCHGAAGDCAATETSCSGTCANLDSDRDNCGACGTTCGDGMTCSSGQCVDGCDPGQSKCGATCIDTTQDQNNCGACGAACTSDQVCTNSACVCAPADITCGGTCTNPQSNEGFCGAAGDCLGSNAGVACNSQQKCVGGACISTRIYRTSLPASTGRWTYGGVLGLDGANAACAAAVPGTQVCAADKLMAAAAAGELINASDTLGNPVTDWWIDDPQAVGPQRCQDGTAENIPWDYQTAHLGNVGKYVTLTPATGAITPVETGSIPAGTGLCSSLRFVPCCSIVTAP